MSAEAIWLVRGDMRDDTEAELAEVFERERPALLRLAWLVSGDAAAAEDTVSEVVAKALPAWREGRIDSPAAYLRTAVVRELTSRGRRASVAKRFAHLFTTPVAAPPTPGYEDRDHLATALDRLPKRQRAVVVLRYYLDLSEAEIAEALGIAPGTVKSQASKALAALRTTLEAEEDR